jgi:hypothetical protein
MSFIWLCGLIVPSTGPLTEPAKKALAVLDTPEQQVAAKRLWEKWGLGRGKVRQQLEMVALSPIDEFDFTDGLLIPHLWQALRVVTFPNTSNRRSLLKPSYSCCAHISFELLSG